ncbi:MAG: beta-hydroxydecanoyl-ACP dehydrase [Fibrobacteres bacterium]|nr:beta-hydroxydecanoyl-ACP dehydrase [Fibrobacterota bacterium]
MNDLIEICRRPIAQLLPHRAPMILIDEACGMEGDSFKAKVRITPASPFFAGDGVPAWVGLEYMAQTVAAYSGAQGLASGGEVKVGMLLGTREFTAEEPVFKDGQELEVLARIDIFQENGVSSMHCRIRDPGGRILAQAQITVIDVPDIRKFLEERST